MKKLLFLLLLLPSLSWGQETMVARNTYYLGAGTVVAAPSCTTGGVACTGESDGAYEPGRYVDRKYVAARFTTTSTSPICKITASINKTAGGNPDYNIRACIFSNNAAATPDTPDALVGTCSDWVTQSDVTTSYTDISFNNMASGALSNATLYWVVLESSEEASDNTYYYNWARVDGCTTEVAAKSTDKSIWVNLSEYRSMIFQIYH